MLEIFIESFVSILECFITIFFITEFLGSKFGKKQKVIFFLLFFSVDSIYAIYRDHYIAFEGILIYVYMLYYLIYACICLNGSISKKIFASILPFVINGLIIIAIPSTVSFITNIPIYEMVNNFSTLRAITLFLTKIVLMFICLFIIHIQKKSFEELSNLQYNCLSAVLIISLIFSDYMIYRSNFIPTNQFDEILYISTYMGIIICNILCYYLVNKNNHLKIQKKENSLLKSQSKFQQTYINNAVDTYNKARTLKHDLKNHLTAISALISESNNFEAQEYIKTIINENINDIVIMIDCGNYAINAVLSSKMGICKQYGIDFICDITTNLKSVPTVDVCSVLSNAVDNAIEASKKLEHSRIEIHIQRIKNYLSITVKNKTENSVLKNNPSLITTKDDPSLHGIGIKSMKAIAKLYEGSVDFSEHEDIFICNVLMKIF